MKISFDPHEKPFAIGNVNYVGVQRPEGYHVSFFEGRNQHSFLYTAHGSMRYSFFDPNQETIDAAAGDLVFLPEKARHGSTYMGNENSVDIVQFDLIAGQLPDYLGAPCLIRAQQVPALFASIRSGLQSGMGDRPMYLLYRTYELFWHLSQNHQGLPAKFRKLQPALNELRTYYSDSRKIQYYADLCGMSEPGFRRLFREYMQLSPIEYRNQIRLQEAKNLLGSGEFTVEEVAFQVGFSNISFFCRSYKRQFGHSPGQDT